MKKLDLALIESEHLSKAMKRLGWNAWNKRRNVPFQIGLDKGRKPFEALSLRFRAKAVRESSSHPKRLAGIVRDTNYFRFPGMESALSTLFCPQASPQTAARDE